MLATLVPFLVLLLVAVCVNHIPMDAIFKKVCNLIFGIVAIVMILQYANLL